tara:strand:- start:370 stop:552 length:183 start_codon:yes stop_codon:yes gene_type:complete
MLIKLFVYLLELCNVIDNKNKDKNIKQKQQDYEEVCNNMPNKYLHHLEDPEDYFYHPIEF